MFSHVSGHDQVYEHEDLIHSGVVTHREKFFRGSLTHHVFEASRRARAALSAAIRACLDAGGTPLLATPPSG